jgi:GTP-binding protein
LADDDEIGRPSAFAVGAEPGDDNDARPYVHRPLGEKTVEISRGPDGVFVVGGRMALRAVALSDLTDDDALDLVQARLKRLGVERALVRAGARDGDAVMIGELSFTYHPDDLAPREEETDRSAGRQGRRKKKQGP